jgi:hypothetical protein
MSRRPTPVRTTFLKQSRQRRDLHQPRYTRVEEVKLIYKPLKPRNTNTRGSLIIYRIRIPGILHNTIHTHTQSVYLALLPKHQVSKTRLTTRNTPLAEFVGGLTSISRWFRWRHHTEVAEKVGVHPLVAPTETDRSVNSLKGQYSDFQYESLHNLKLL